MLLVCFSSPISFLHVVRASSRQWCTCIIIFAKLLRTCTCPPRHEQGRGLVIKVSRRLVKQVGEELRGMVYIWCTPSIFELVVVMGVRRVFAKKRRWGHKINYFGCDDCPSKHLGCRSAPPSINRWSALLAQPICFLQHMLVRPQPAASLAARAKNESAHGKNAGAHEQQRTQT
jgi:hypothetical protein